MTILRRRLPTLLLTALLALIGLWLYWPGVVAAPILDDLGNLQKLARLADNPEYARDYVFGNRSGLLGRPVAMATFVAETLYLDHIPHITLKLNVALHLLNGLLVTLLLWLLFERASFRRAGVLAALLGGLWLLAPLQVSTVLYQVQRMAMLATTFMLLACICYVLWRGGARRWPWLLACIASVGLALFSKENAVVVVPVILLLEVLWLAGEAGPRQTRTGRFALWAIGLGAGAVLAGVVLWWGTLQDMHAVRHFTLEERLLTQSRALWDYAGQFLWPDLARLGLYHDDFLLSRSLGDPVTTTWALAGQAALLVAGLFATRYYWGRLLLLGPAFYLVAHGLEGSVFPLELYFEHRNYFPSVGLVILLGAMIGLLARAWPQVTAPLAAWLGFAIILMAMMTSSQVQIWSVPQLRVMHHVNGHPASFRANADMAVLLAEAGGLEQARPYARRAAEAGSMMNAGDHAIFALLLDCLAGAQFDRDTLASIGAGPGSNPGSSNILLSLVRAVQADNCPDVGLDRFSERMAEVFIEGSAEGTDRLFFALASLENKLEHYARANAYADRFLARTARRSTALLMKLHFLTALGDRGGVEQVVAELQRMDRAGQLTTQERDNLGYYLHPANEP